MPPITSANLGFPRLGAQRELKWALERAWKSGEFDELRATAAMLRARHWKLQTDAGIDAVPVGDFSLYDHIGDLAVALGAVPERFGTIDTDPTSDDALRRFFAMGRGGDLDGGTVAPLEMTKWFDTNYHQLVPELDPGGHFEAHPAGYVAELAEALEQSVPARVALVGPVTFLVRSKRTDGGDTLALADALAPAYAALIAALRDAGARAFQLDESALVTDLGDGAARAYATLYEAVRTASRDAQVTVTAPFGSLGPNTSLALRLPVDVVHLDLVRGAHQLDEVVAALPEHLGLSLGVVDGRNIWRSDLDPIIATVKDVVKQIGAERVTVAPSCSLLHLPVDLSGETDLDPELRSWLAFATERLDEVRIIAAVVNGEGDHVADALAQNRAAAGSRRASTRVHDPAVAARVGAITPTMASRHAAYGERAAAQRAELGLPLLPTTTIGSFPQTTRIRSLRKAFRVGEIDRDAYEQGLREAIDDCIRIQEDLDLDVLVHGEFERTDMVEYFGQQLEGFATTRNGWVQSYGSRGVKPPIIFGDVQRTAPMTTDWITYAAGRTDRPMKAMLTGPVTILAWSFVRDDQAEATTARQVALALRDEVDDLVAAGIRIVQIDEPALREGLPLREEDRAAYLDWATESFRLSAGSAPDGVQIHTHMCYADFSDIIDAIVDMDADVISMEASRSDMELLDDFISREYPNEIGPGIWDIHSPRVPDDTELDGLLDRAIERFGAERLWVNPDCGLKTRGWPETKASLANLVAAAHRARDRVGAG